MARVLFLMKYPLDGPDSLCPKFDGQMAGVRSLGHQTRFLGWSQTGIWLCGGEQPLLVRKTRLARLPGYAHTLLFVHLMQALQRAVAMEPFDLIYMRYMPTFSDAPKALKAAKAAGARLVVEHPTYPFQKGKKTSLLREPVFRYVERVFRKVLPLIDLFTLIGDPCQGLLDGRPAMNISNGVDAEAFPLHRPRKEEEEVAMLALASMQRVQGYDRLIRAMAGRKEKLRLYMVGGEVDGSLAEWKRLCQELGLEHSVEFIGPLYRESLNEMVERCDIGVGGLGAYRENQYENRSLKNREYMARGLPFVYAVEDADMPEGGRFCMRVPNDESLPDMDEILRFARAAKRDVQGPALMRAYARKHLSWAAILKPVLERMGMKCQEP